MLRTLIALSNTGELVISEIVKLFQMLQWPDMKSLNYAARKTPNQRKFNALPNVAAADMKNLKSNTGELLISERVKLFQMLRLRR